MEKRMWVECPACGYQDQVARPSLSCPSCGGDWLDMRYDYSALKDRLPNLLATRPFTMWRYWDLLPLRNPANVLTMGEGGTPLLHATNLGMMLGRPNIFCQDARQGPTGSFKDRQASLAISYMKEQGIT
jgi:threonine synthase